MAYLLDVNMLVALMNPNHTHSAKAAAWVNSQLDADSLLICRVSQMGALRILTNSTVMKLDVQTPAAFWVSWARLMSDIRFKMIQEPAGFEVVWQDVSCRLPPGQRADTDVYFAALAEAGNWRMATFDKGFKRFTTLNLEILS